MDPRELTHCRARESRLPRRRVPLIREERLGLAALGRGLGGVAGALQQGGQALVGRDRVGMVGEDAAQLDDRRVGMAEIVQGHGEDEPGALVGRVERERGAQRLQGGGRLAP